MSLNATRNTSARQLPVLTHGYLGNTMRSALDDEAQAMLAALTAGQVANTPMGRHRITCFAKPGTVKVTYKRTGKRFLVATATY